MEDLIKALQIFLKYGNPTYPTHCEHDVLYVCVSPKGMSKENIKELDDLGFFPCNGNAESYEDDFDGEYEDDDYFMSYKYGSC